MTASEFVFLGMGLILGVAAGAALIDVIRARPPARREVRLTVAPDAVPRRRAATLASDAFTDSPVALDPARGGPADQRGMSLADAPAIAEGRTPVLSPRPVGGAQPAFRLSRMGPRLAEGSSSEPPAPAVLAHGMPVSSGIDPMLTALRASAAASAAIQTAARTAVRTEIRAEARTEASENGARPAAEVRARRPQAPAPTDPPTDAPSGPCGSARRLADERCELAGRARSGAVEAEEAHRAAQRAYDGHEAAIAEASVATDARNVRDAKDQAQARFRAGRAGARSQHDVEAAAREWLLEINRINARTGEATAVLQRAQTATPDLALRLERTAVAADAARIAAEGAEAACVAARQALAECEEHAASGLPGAGRSSHVDARKDPRDKDASDMTGDTLVAALRAGAAPRIVRLLRGDRAAMFEAVKALAGDDPEARRRWQAALSDLVDAILADAISASALEFPTDHQFWGPFSRTQGRDIAAALSSLGYRFDGLGGWVDDRSPSQRDLSLALGYAGLDPMRMRHWPNESEMTTLFGDVRVAAAEHLATAAGDMTLGELVAMLGRRADGLTEIWNAWGRVRPILLDES